MKQHYQRTQVECHSDIVDVVIKSGYINHTRHKIHKMAKFSNYLTTSRQLQEASKGSINLNFQHADHLGEAICKLYSNSEKTKLDMSVNPLWQPSISDPSLLVQLLGLSADRKCICVKMHLCEKYVLLYWQVCGFDVSYTITSSSINNFSTCSNNLLCYTIISSSTSI